MKTIKIKACSKCPHFVEFPADCFEGDCANRAVPDKQDSRIVDKDSIPSWCPL
jgi:hypothetical protein